MNKMTCLVCSLRKLIIRPSSTKIDKEILKFFAGIQGLYVDQFMYHVDYFNIYGIN